MADSGSCCGQATAQAADAEPAPPSADELVSALLLYQLMQCLDVEIDADDDGPTRRLMCACHPPSIASIAWLLYSVHLPCILPSATREDSQAFAACQSRQDRKVPHDAR